MTVKEMLGKLGSFNVDGFISTWQKGKESLKVAWGELPRIGKWLAAIILVVAAVFITFRISEAIFFFGIYRSWFSSFHGAGLPDGVSGLLAFLCALGTFAAVPSLLSLLFWRRSLKSYATVGGVALGLALVSYFLSQPGEGQYFNPVSGSPMYKYSKDANGNISLFSVGYSFDPVSGRKLEPVNTQIIEVYLKQLAARPKPVVKTAADKDTLPVDEEYSQVKFETKPQSINVEGCIVKIAGIKVERAEKGNKLYFLMHVFPSGEFLMPCELHKEQSADFVLTDNMGRMTSEFSSSMETNHRLMNSSGTEDHVRLVKENEVYAYLLIVPYVDSKARVFNVDLRARYMRLEIQDQLLRPLVPVTP